MTKRIALSAVLATLMGMAGCVSTSNIVETGRDTYMISSTADGFRSASSARESALEAGASKCKSMGKRLQVTDDAMARTRMGIDTTINVTFRCLAEDDPRR